MTQTDEITQWVTKEITSLINSANRLALLAIIKQYQDEGIYGYLIGEKLVETTHGELDASKATFYAILRRFEKEGLVEHKLKVSTSGPARKHYHLTSKGEQAYRALWQNWIHYYEILENLIENNEMNIL